MTQLSINYNPENQRLTFQVDGEERGGLTGELAEKKFKEALDTGAKINLTQMDYKKKKIRRLRAIWFKLGIDHMRADILAQYDVVSTKDLSELQLDELIKCYGDQLDSPRDIRKERSIVIMLLTEMDIYKNDGNWERVNEYLMNDRIAGKLLFQMSKQELKALQIKLRAIKNKNIEKELTYCPN